MVKTFKFEIFKNGPNCDALHSEYKKLQYATKTSIVEEIIEDFDAQIVIGDFSVGYKCDEWILEDFVEYHTADEHIVYIAQYDDLKKFVWADIEALAKVKDIPVDVLKDDFDFGEQHTYALSSNKNVVLQVYVNPSINDFKSAINDLILDCGGRKISIYLGCHTVYKDNEYNLVFKNNESFSPSTFSEWLKSIKLQHQPDLTIFFECCYSLQFVSAVLNKQKSLLMFFYWWNAANLCLTENQEIAKLFDLFKSDYKTEKNDKGKNFMEIIESIENGPNFIDFFKDFHQKASDKLKHHAIECEITNMKSLVIYGDFHARVQSQKNFEFKFEGGKIGYLIPLSFTKVPGHGIIASALNDKKWIDRDFKIFRFDPATIGLIIGGTSLALNMSDRIIGYPLRKWRKLKLEKNLVSANSEFEMDIQLYRYCHYYRDSNMTEYDMFAKLNKLMIKNNKSEISFDKISKQWQRAKGNLSDEKQTLIIKRLDQQLEIQKQQLEIQEQQLELLRLNSTIKKETGDNKDTQ